MREAPRLFPIMYSSIGRGIQARRHESDHLRRPRARGVDLGRVHHIDIRSMTQDARSPSRNRSTNGERRERKHAQIRSIEHNQPRHVSSYIYEGPSQAQQLVHGDVQLDLIILIFLVVDERWWCFDDGFLDRRFILLYVLVVEIALEVRNLPPDPHVVRKRE